MFIDFRERKGGVREREGEREMWERNIDQLPSVNALGRDQTCNLGMCLTRNWTHNLSVYGTMLQPTEPPGQGHTHSFRWQPQTWVKLRFSVKLWNTHSIGIYNFSSKITSKCLIKLPNAYRKTACWVTGSCILISHYDFFRNGIYWEDNCILLWPLFHFGFTEA